MRLRSMCVVFAVVALGACGGDGGSTEEEDPDPTVNETATEPTAADEGSESTGGDPVGTATIDGTEYTIVASLQCLVALDQANQISISGDVEEYESDAPYEWQYDWDSDDGFNEFSITVGDAPEDEYRAMGTFSDPEVDGETVRASGTVLRGGVDSFDASFEIDCAS